ncbi:hypothetical protein BE11_15745 [Sorangium cellulosum]|nr:hypothetical protein BE11_15745 [Sorangium cellulosum]
MSAAFIRELLRRAALFAADAGRGTAVAEEDLKEALHELLVDGGAAHPEPPRRSGPPPLVITPSRPPGRTSPAAGIQAGERTAMTPGAPGTQGK